MLPAARSYGRSIMPVGRVPTAVENGDDAFNLTCGRAMQPYARVAQTLHRNRKSHLETTNLAHSPLDPSFLPLKDQSLATEKHDESQDTLTTADSRSAVLHILLWRLRQLASCFIYHHLGHLIAPRRAGQRQKTRKRRGSKRLSNTLSCAVPKPCRHCAVPTGTRRTSATDCVDHQAIRGRSMTKDSGLAAPKATTTHLGSRSPMRPHVRVYLGISPLD
ncbi:hypothetical protein HYQ46_002295 [Verticillium longisporum]|nr:hypothetical protein HYQ46_002295 [Verticillium longisporum]